MAIDVESLVQAMTTAGATAFKNSWGQAQSYAVPEFRKIAIQIAAIETGSYAQDVAKKLIEMQKEAAVDVLIALLEMTVFEIEKAINAVLAAIKTQVNAALKFALL